MKFALAGALALAFAVLLSGCSAAIQGAVNAAAPTLEAAACDAIEKTAPAQTACVNVAGVIVTVGEAIAANAAPAPAPAPSPPRKGK